MRTATLRLTIDNGLSFRHYVSIICSSAYFHLRALHHIKGILTEIIWLRVAIPDVHLYFCQHIAATVPLLKIIVHDI